MQRVTSPRMLRALLLSSALGALAGCGDDGGSFDRSEDAAVDAGSSNPPADAAGGTTRDAATPSDASGNTAPVTTYGERYSGGEFHLGPVDWSESAFHNACAAGTKYPARVQEAEGALLAGIWGGIGSPEKYCDACIYVETARGKSALLRVVTYGATTPNSIDVSREAFALLNAGESPRTMSFRFAKCSDSGKLMYEFKAGAHEDWTAFWVRNARVPIERVEVMGVKHAYAACRRDSDGSLVDDRGFGKGTFSIRVTGIDGQSRIDTFSWPASGVGGQLLEGAGNFE